MLKKLITKVVHILRIETIYVKAHKSFIVIQRLTLAKIATIHQVTTTLATSKNILFPAHNHRANHRC